ncbi:Cd2+/Zn2+-exporting ATPase [Halorubrum vacuolatum]|uniref:Cd2+/Zn2+-exporting ATPase n=2 Tax=Halorubrum vacuolatum TaxID=63740 RepID=A0A238VL36_HALVU|nr:Cd2+/Zn2+-exporting ATPase [Halorubrum vacuolatum]
MDCPSCVGKVTNSIEKLDGILNIDARPTTGVLVVEFQSDTLTDEDIHDRITAAGYTVEIGDETTRLAVPAMDCPSCAQKVEKALEDVEGITEIESQPTTGQVTITHDATITPDEIISHIASAGYKATTIDEERRFGTPREIWKSPRGVATLVGGVLVTAGMILNFAVPTADPFLFELVGRTFNVSHVLFVVSAALAGAPIIRNGYYSARNWSLDIHFLMTAGIIGSVLTHHAFEGAMLAVLFSTAELLERFSMDRARGSLRELMELSPDTATVRRDGQEETIPANQVTVGETVIVRPGEKIPLDGIVIEGTSAVNQAPITGESVPVDKAKGEEVYAGTINEEGYLEIEITSESSDSTIAQIIRMVEEVQSEKTEREQFVNRLASVYTPLVVGIALVVMIVPPLAYGASWNTWFLRGLALIVIACPCAFVISTPVSVVSGITSAARNGVLIKTGRDLEAAGDTDVVAVDKTGTVTTGELSVTDVIPFDDVSEEEILRCASSLERRSEHPIAEAIIDHAETRGASGNAITVENFEALTGKGISADLDGNTHFVGKPSLFTDLGFELDETTTATDGGQPVSPTLDTSVDERERNSVSETISTFEDEGKSVVLVGSKDRLYGVIAISDEPRENANWAISKLKEQGVHVVMLTGDNTGTARAIANEVGIEAYHAELLPDEKLEKIQQLEAEHGHVAMVGDGINDAPALATATVGIAMGAAGTDTALETADIALMSDDLTRLPYLHHLSQKSNSVIRQNIWSSLGVKAVLAIGAPFGVVTVIHAVVVGDMGMSLGVTGNAMRLSKVKPDSPNTSEEDS